MKNLSIKLLTAGLLTGFMSIAAYASDGEGLYNNNCTACHGSDFSSTNAGAFDLTTFPDDFDRFKQAVLDGKGIMPGFSSSLSDEDVTALFDYIMS